MPYAFDDPDENACQHPNAQPTDSQGYSMQCPDCGKSWSIEIGTYYDLRDGYVLVAPYRLKLRTDTVIDITDSDYIHDGTLHYFSDMGGREPMEEPFLGGDSHPRTWDEFDDFLNEE